MTQITPSSFKLWRAEFVFSALFFLLVIVLAMGAASAAGTIRTLGGPVAVVDGDTIEVAGERVRLEGIDAPELGQDCTSSAGTSWECGKAASQALRKLVGGRDVICDSRGNDKYLRTLAVCYSDGIEINAEMVRTGLAWAFVKYSQTYVSEEQTARAAKAGVWQGEATPAWEYRHRGWTSAEPAAPKGCAIKGNVSSKGRIFHMPWSPWYNQVTVDPARGERWFCSEGEALAAGWRPVAGS